MNGRPQFMKRGRNHRPHRRQGPNINRALDSNGPDVRIRGTANQIYDKYLALARDANSSGDRVKAENYLQHAEHYFRIIKALQPQQQPSGETGEADGDQPMIGGEDDRFSDARELRSQDQNGGNNGGQHGGQNVGHRPPEQPGDEEMSNEQPDVPEQRMNGEGESRPQHSQGQQQSSQHGQGGYGDNDREGRRRRRRPRRFPREGGEGGQGEASGEAQGDSGDSEPADVAAE